MTFTNNLSMRRPWAVLLMSLLLSTSVLAEKPDGAGGGNGKGHGNGAGNGKSEQRGPGKSEHRVTQTQSSPGERSDRPEKAARADKGKQAMRQPAQDTVKVGSYFGDNQRSAVRTYYSSQYSAGRCPPGLAKKNNGCMPPGQAKKWVVGQRLPSNVTYYSVPQSVVVQLGAPPPSYKYVRVAADILLIGIGTNMVVDSIQDLGRL